MSILNGERVNALVSNNAWISKNSYASDSDYALAQVTYSVPFPDPSKAHIYYNSVLKEFRFHDGLIWQSLSIGSTANKAFFHATINPMGQSIPAQATNATSVKVAWNSVIADNESKWSAINNQYEVPRDGKYLVTAMARVQGQVNNYTGGAFMSIFIDNVIHKEFINDFIGTGVTPPPVSPYGSRLNGSIVLDLSAGNLVDTRIFLSNTFWSGATLTSSNGVIHFDLKIIEL